MINLRIAGMIMALGSSFVFYRMYRTRGGKSPLLIGFLFSGSLLAVAIEPDILNGLFHLLVQSRHRYYRIIILLVFGIIVLGILVIRALFTLSFHERTIRDLVFRLGLKEFDERYDSGKIKPIQIVIPALNEAQNLRTVLPRIPEEVCGHPVGVLVVSDGSTDQTVATARNLGVACVENLISGGTGTALRLGFEISRRHGSRIVVSMDADGQHDPKEISRLVRPILDGEVEMTLGTRVLGDDHTQSRLRKAGITFFSGLLSLLLMRRITDCSNGFRAYHTRIIDHLDYEEPQFYTTEFLVQLLSRDVQYKEVPITVKARNQGNSKKPYDLQYGWKFFSVLLKSWWRH